MDAMKEARGLLQQALADLEEEQTRINRAIGALDGKSGSTTANKSKRKTRSDKGKSRKRQPAAANA